MKRFFQFAIIFSGLVLSTNVFADVKIKIRQTMSGQTFENTTYIKGKRQRAEQNMGGTQMVTITQCDLKRSLQIMPVSQTYLINSWENASGVAPSTTTKTVTSQPTKGGLVTTTVTIKDTGERKKMFGYEARHLIITMETEPSPEACQKTKNKIETDGWYIDAAFGVDCETERYASYSNQQKPTGCQDRFETKQVGTGKRGFAVYEKMTMFDENGKESFSTISEVLEFSKATLEDSLFDVPAGYREVKNAAEMYQTAGYSGSSNSSSSSTNYGNSGNYETTNNSGMSQNVQNLSKNNSAPSTEVGAKKEGVVRLGIANVKTGQVGEGLNATELAGAIQNTLGEYLKGTKVELVQIEAKLPSAITEEAAQKQCDYIIYANVSHKKGGGGFGMFKKVAPMLGAVVPMAGVAGVVASSVIYTAAGMAGNIKSKDEITLDLKLQNGNTVVLTKQFKAKAKSDGEDIISPLVEQAAQAILDSVAK